MPVTGISLIIFLISSYFDNDNATLKTRLQTFNNMLKTINKLLKSKNFKISKISFFIIIII